MYYASKKSAHWYACKSQDIYTDLGYNYHGNIFKKTVSPVILSNKVNNAILSKIEVLISYLVDVTKQIRLQYMISLKKNDTRLN